jgi:hypothetical protein
VAASHSNQFLAFREQVAAFTKNNKKYILCITVFKQFSIMFICLLYFFCGLSRDGSGNTWHPVSSHFILHPLMVADKILGHCLGAKRQSGERDENSSHVVRK